MSKLSTEQPVVCKYSRNLLKFQRQCLCSVQCSCSKVHHCFAEIRLSETYAIKYNDWKRLAENPRITNTPKLWIAHIHQLRRTKQRFCEIQPQTNRILRTIRHVGRNSFSSTQCIWSCSIDILTHALRKQTVNYTYCWYKTQHSRTEIISHW